MPEPVSGLILEKQHSLYTFDKQDDKDFEVLKTKLENLELKITSLDLKQQVNFSINNLG
jgi:hypothetical protein